ncbi:transposase family protein [Streptomyces sp. M10(2022)]
MPERDTNWSSSTACWRPWSHLRHGATHDVLACWFGVDRSTITPSTLLAHPAGLGLCRRRDLA